MNSALRIALGAAGLAIATQAAAQVTFYEGEGFQGRSFTTRKQVGDLERFGFNDRASSVVVAGDRWEVCDDARFRGNCIVLRPGRYPSLAAMGLGERISSVRMVRRNARVDDDRYAPQPAVQPDYRRRDHERLYQANVTSVHAVVATPGRHCWVEHDQVPQERGSANVPGAVVGAVLGGILGHQIGNGRGQDVATIGGAVAGGAIGANVGRDRAGSAGYAQDVQHCESVPRDARTEYWDVTYDFRGNEHRMQVTAPPGRTVTVNEQGEPRS
ncbi:MAG TPA: beta/gamma crystallin-related protein [Usitatibacter sp.]|nr:beta/gamma crystallin-related protein [Usitatibacter sp.]